MNRPAPTATLVRNLDVEWYSIAEYDVEDTGASIEAASLRRTVCRRGDRVAVLPYRTGDLAVVLCEQFRLPVRVAEGGGSGACLEVPGGLVDDEPVEVAARREVLEETGLRLGDLMACGSTFLIPGLVAERTHLFLAPQLEFPVATGRTGVEAEGEDLRCSIWAWDEAWRAVEQGQIVDAKTVMLLLRLRCQSAAHGS